MGGGGGGGGATLEAAGSVTVTEPALENTLQGQRLQKPHPPGLISSVSSSSLSESDGEEGAGGGGGGRGGRGGGREEGTEGAEAKGGGSEWSPHQARSKDRGKSLLIKNVLYIFTVRYIPV